MNSNNSKLNGRLNASPAAHQFFHRSATAYLYTTAATSLNWEWLVVTIAKTDGGCVAIKRFFHVLYFKPCIWTYRDVCGAVLSVLCLFPYNVDVTATSWGALRHTQRERSASASNGTFGTYLDKRYKIGSGAHSNRWKSILMTFAFFFYRLSERNCLNIRTYRYSLKSQLNRQI